MELWAVFAKLTLVENTYPETDAAFTSAQSNLIPMNPNNPPWNGWVAIGVWVASVLAIVIFPTLFLAPYIVQVNGQFTDKNQLVEFAKTDPTAIILQIAAIIPAHLFTLILSWLVVTRMRNFSFRQTLGWKSGGMLWWHFIVIIVGFFALAAVIGNYFPEQETDMARILKSSRTAVFIVVFLATFTAPLVEEVVYRGILYSAFQRRFGIPVAVAAVTAIFTLVHVPQYLESLSTIFLLALLSLILTLVRVRTNNLLPCIILHTVFNGIQSVLLILEPYFPKIASPTDVPASIIDLLK